MNRPVTDQAPVDLDRKIASLSPHIALEAVQSALWIHCQPRFSVILGFRRFILHDGFAGSSLGLLKKRVDVDHINLRLRVKVLQEWPFERIVFEVRKTQQVIAFRVRREPLVRCLAGEPKYSAAIAEK